MSRFYISNQGPQETTITLLLCYCEGTELWMLVVELNRQYMWRHWWEGRLESSICIIYMYPKFIEVIVRSKTLNFPERGITTVDSPSFSRNVASMGIN